MCVKTNQFLHFLRLVLMKMEKLQLKVRLLYIIKASILYNRIERKSFLKKLFTFCYQL